MPLADYVNPLHYNSECISLFTLCLAPLVAHVTSGTPPISYLISKRPRWYDTVCHYNPTSIIWRYAAIIERRLRANAWDRHDLGSSNAILWTVTGWEGEDDMRMVAEPHCVRSPDSTHARILSIAMVKIIIATLQGISPLCSVIGSLTNTLDSANFKGVASVDTIFFPLAILGLLRLCAAPWLTDDYQFSQQATQDKDLVSSTPLGHKGLDHINREMDLMIGPNNCDPFLLMQRTTTSRFKSPQSSWPSRMFRTSYLLVFGGIWTMSFLNMIPISFAGIVLSYTSTSFLTCLFYLFFLTVSIATFAVYFVRSQTTSTVLPCISSWWYRAYTLIVFTFMLTLVIVASTETNRGVDRLHSAEVPDVNPTCAELGSVWSFSYSRPGFGSATPSDWTGVVGYRITQDDQASTVDEYRLVDFIGYATGREGSPTVVSGTSNFSQSD